MKRATYRSSKEVKHTGTLTCIFCLAIWSGTIAYAQAERNPPLVPEKDYFAEPFDKYDDISWDNEKARLDNFAIALLEDPRLTGYIIVYAGKNSCAGAAQRRGMRAKKYLVERLGVDWNRVIWKDAGYLERPYVMLWGQTRGEAPYPYHQPKPLTDVKVRRCGAKANRLKTSGRK